MSGEYTGEALQASIDGNQFSIIKAIIDENPKLLNEYSVIRYPYPNQRNLGKEYYVHFFSFIIYLSLI